MSNSYLGDAVTHYGALFTMPSHRRIVTYLFLSWVIGGTLAFFVINPTTSSLLQGMMFGFFFAGASLLADIITRLALTRNDLILTLRRCSSLSFLMGSTWAAILIGGSVVGMAIHVPWIVIYAFILGFSLIFSVRFLVVSSISSLTIWRSLVAAFLQPFFCFLVATTFWNLMTPHYILAIGETSLILLASMLIFSQTINRYGKKKIGIGTVSLFKAFVADWIAGVNRPLENFLEKLGHSESVFITTLGFRGKKGIKAIINVPAFHPGPFKNVGSSTLTFKIQEMLEKAKHAIVCVPHGASGHELDLASQAENEKVLKKVMQLSHFTNFAEKATHLIRVKVNSAKATAQIFGKCAFVTLTCAPKFMEDIPREVGQKIVNIGEQLGLSAVAVVDAHNSIEGNDFSLDEYDVQNLQKAAERALSTASKKPVKKFEIGIAKVIPNEFTLAQGMGPGGIVALVVRVERQLVAYIVIDSNNLINGLREKILKALKELGISDGEVMTTDTHMVNGVTLVKRGYHPFGEVIPHKKILGYVKGVTQLAISDLHESEVAWNSGVVRQVKAIGPKYLKELATLVDSTAKLTKKMALTIFPIGILASILLLMFI